MSEVLISKKNEHLLNSHFVFLPEISLVEGKYTVKAA
jgi:hypothetical protein